MGSHILSDIFFSKKWKMERKLEDICGTGKFNTVSKIIKYSIIAVVLIFIIVMILQTFGLLNVPVRTVNENGESSIIFSKFIYGSDTTNAIYNPLEILEAFVGFVTGLATLYTCLQIYLMKDINRMEMSHEIYKDNQKYRQIADDAIKELHALHKKIQDEEITVETERELYEKNEESKFHTLLISGEFEHLRSFAYHYEYLGYLTLRDKLNFDVAFDTITFYNWLIVSKEAREIIEIGRQFTPDFWNGSEYLYLSYEVRRKYNKYKGYDSATPKEKAKTTKDQLKNDFDEACENWKEKYQKIA